METQDTCCTFVPYFKIHEGKLNEARALCDKFVEKTREEAKVMFYGFTFDADHMSLPGRLSGRGWSARSP